MRKSILPLMLALGFFISFLPATGRAEVKCPWLNAATASGVLGGDVLMTVQKSPNQVEGKGSGAATYPDQIRADRFDASCTFTRRTDSGVSTLTIIVKTMTDPASDFPLLLASCAGQAVPLKGIGNEAIHCVPESRGHSGNSGREQVIARVRDRTFVLIVGREKPPGTAANSDLSNETRNVAEQVAGSIF